MNQTPITIPTPRGFDFRRTAISHGWYDLPPFELDSKRWTLTRVIPLGRARPVTVSISAATHHLRIVVNDVIREAAIERVTRHVRHIFRLDDDLSKFYGAVVEHPEFEWIAAAGAGRLLRSPTVFEDLVKTICTTNCSWALTSKMVSALVNALGRKTRDERKSFPTAEAMAEMPVAFYRDEVRAGYRAEYLKELAERVAGGELDPEEWIRSALPTPELKRAMKQVKGVGDYAAENLLRLVGRYDVLALDSWVRATFSRLRNKRRKASDKKIEKYYSQFGEWRGLALWCDMTRDWLNVDGHLKW